MQTMKQAAAEFLVGKRVAVTGVSRNPQGHGSNAVYQRLRQRGYEVFAVNPNADQVEGGPCYHDLASIPGGVDWVVIGTKPETAEATIGECADLGIKRVWMHRGPGAGSVSPPSRRVRPPARHHRDRGRVPVHVRPHRRSRPQGDAVRARPDGQRASGACNSKEAETGGRPGPGRCGRPRSSPDWPTAAAGLVVAMNHVLSGRHRRARGPGPAGG